MKKTFEILQFLTPEDGTRGPKSVVNKNLLRCVDCTLDYLFYKKEHNGMSTLKVVKKYLKQSLQLLPISMP